MLHLGFFPFLLHDPAELLSSASLRSLAPCLGIPRPIYNILYDINRVVRRVFQVGRMQRGTGGIRTIPEESLYNELGRAFALGPDKRVQSAVHRAARLLGLRAESV